MAYSASSLRQSDARSSNSSAPDAKSVVVLIDGSSLFLAARALADGSARLNYRTLVEVLCQEVPGLKPAPQITRTPSWVMWTAAAADNEGQQKFLDFAERDLHWEVRRFSPSLAFSIEPSAVFGVAGVGDSTKTSRLIRFDASIAFAIGRLSEEHRVVVVSDSFPLSEPMLRVNEHQKSNDHCTLAFFGRAIDARWYVAFKNPHAPRFLNLDDFETDLFGLPRKEVARTSKGAKLY